MIWILLFVCALAAGPVCTFRSDLDSDTALVGWWKLAEDCRDDSICRNDGDNHGCRFGQPVADRHKNGAALFDGRRSYVEVANNETLNVGTGDFSISVYVQTTADGDDLIGDIVSKYDPVSRKGFHLNVQCNTGVTSSQANRRNVHFGIDDGQIDSGWTDSGRPGEAVLVYSMAVFDGNLYAGTCEAKPEQSGHVYRYAGGTEWVDCGSPAPCNAVSCLAVYRGRLYAGVSKYRLGGSALEESQNPHPGGKVYRYEGGQSWTDCGKLGSAEALNGMVVYRDRLYVSSMYSPGLFRYEGDTNWRSCGSPNGERVEALSVYNGAIYATGYDKAGVYRYDGERWATLGIMKDCNQTYGFGVYRGELYVSSWPRSALFRYLGGTDWKSVGRLGEELESMPLVVYNGKLYSGSLPSAGVFRYDGGEEWSPLGHVDQTPNVKYRRAWSMAVYQGRLFVGTLPSGRVKSLQAGRSVTDDRTLGTGWKHLTAVKKGGKLTLYVDGNCVAVSTPFDPSAYELSNNAPLTVGFGARDYFNGRLKNLRIYKRALSETEIEYLMQTDGKPGG